MEKYKKQAKNMRECYILANELYGNYCVVSHERAVDFHHVIKRSQSKKMQLIPMNCIPLSREIHTKIESNINPITGNRMKSWSDRAAFYSQLLGWKWDILLELLNTC